MNRKKKNNNYSFIIVILLICTFIVTFYNFILLAEMGKMKDFHGKQLDEIQQQLTELQNETKNNDGKEVGEMLWKYLTYPFHSDTIILSWVERIFLWRNSIFRN